MNIKQASERSGLSVDTIRFYEKSGMLPRIGRGLRGWRSFSADNLNWLETLQRLRATGMPLKAVKRFAVLVHQRPDTKAAARERLQILVEHSDRLKHRRTELEACEKYLNFKISVYQKQGGKT
jgi:MerR family transcriptional regulator, aldehyde-responsive regulator